MSTAKEKAKELVDKYYLKIKENKYHYVHQTAVECAIVAVDEILNNFGLVADGKMFYTEYRAIEYWQEVKEELL